MFCSTCEPAYIRTAWKNAKLGIKGTEYALVDVETPGKNPGKVTIVFQVKAPVALRQATGDGEKTCLDCGSELPVDVEAAV